MPVGTRRLERGEVVAYCARRRLCRHAQALSLPTARRVDRYPTAILGFERLEDDLTVDAKVGEFGRGERPLTGQPCGLTPTAGTSSWVERHDENVVTKPPLSR